MISPELSELKFAYASELRKSKQAAEDWWNQLEETHADTPVEPDPRDLWPMGPASHPWVIATYRKYYFLCQELNQRVERENRDLSQNVEAGEADWGAEDEEPMVTTVEPKVFVLDLLSGGDTHDLYEFLLSLVLVPIGIKADEPV
jgi:hypothetical protein